MLPDRHLKRHNRHIIIPIFVPHKGCPFDCIYCNQKTISGQVEEMTGTEMRRIIEAHISSAVEAEYMEIAFFGGSFTGIEKDEQIRFLEIANEYIKEGPVRGIRLSTRPDYIDREILDYLKKYNVKIIELGVQSLDEDVLRLSCRGHSVSDVEKSVRLIKEYGIRLGIQTMIGLPGDSSEKDIITAEKVIELSPEIVRIYPTLVIRGTYLEKLYNEGKYKAPGLEEAVEICSELLNMYGKAGINVIRVGLQPTDTIKEGLDVVAGPFHPAFRQLAEARLGLKSIEKGIKDKGLANEKAITIYTGERNLDSVIGQKKENIKRLREEYGFIKIEVKTDCKLDRTIVVERTKDPQ